MSLSASGARLSPSDVTSRVSPAAASVCRRAPPGHLCTSALSRPRSLPPAASASSGREASKPASDSLGACRLHACQPVSPAVSRPRIRSRRLSVPPCPASAAAPVPAAAGPRNRRPASPCPATHCRRSNPHRDIVLQPLPVPARVHPACRGAGQRPGPLLGPPGARSGTATEARAVSLFPARARPGPGPRRGGSVPRLPAGARPTRTGDGLRTDSGPRVTDRLRVFHHARTTGRTIPARGGQRAALVRQASRVIISRWRRTH